MRKVFPRKNFFWRPSCRSTAPPYFATWCLCLGTTGEDVNKRTARVAANIPLLKNDLCPLSFMNVSEQDYIDGTLGVYELNDVSLLRHAFVEDYVRSAEALYSCRSK